MSTTKQNESFKSLPTLTVSLSDAVQLITTVADNVTLMFSGEMGIGKSSLLKALEERYGDAYHYRYVDMAMLDLGDISMPRIDPALPYVEFIPNLNFYSPDGKPLMILMDELGKAPRPVLNAAMPILYDRRVGSYKLPPGTRVFCATNLNLEGLGDNLPAHLRNRMTQLIIRKPNAEEWMAWANMNDVEPIVVGFVKDFPHVLASFLDGISESEPYIFNPKHPTSSFVSPRSLVAASHIIKQRQHYSPQLLVAALSGAAGEAFAREIQAYIEVGDDMPKWDDIVKHPATTDLPKNGMSAAVLTMKAAQLMREENVDQWMEYLLRLPKEVQMMFVAMVKSMKGHNGALEKYVILTKCGVFRKWAMDNVYLH